MRSSRKPSSPSAKRPSILSRHQIGYKRAEAIIAGRSREEAAARLGYGTIEGDDSQKDPYLRVLELKVEVRGLQQSVSEWMNKVGECNDEHIDELIAERAEKQAAIDWYEELLANQNKRDDAILNVTWSTFVPKVEIARGREKEWQLEAERTARKLAKAKARIAELEDADDSVDDGEEIAELKAEVKELRKSLLGRNEVNEQLKFKAEGLVDVQIHLMITDQLRVSDKAREEQATRLAELEAQLSADKEKHAAEMIAEKERYRILNDNMNSAQDVVDKKIKIISDLRADKARLQQESDERMQMLKNGSMHFYRPEKTRVEERRESERIMRENGVDPANMCRDRGEWLR